MTTHFHKSLIASAIALSAAGLCGTALAGTASQEVTEARQETQIWTTYALNPYLRANDLKVSVHAGKATLSGEVEEGVSKELAEQIALGVSGIQNVDNDIVIKPDYVAPARSSERSYGQSIDDASITAAVKSKLLWSSHADGLSTNVDTKWGKVTLAGTAESAAAKDLATRLALNTRGVTSVDNQLTVKNSPPSMADKAKASAHEAGTDVADSWITAKVKSTYVYSTNVDGSDIAVSTKSGIVTLTGDVDSGAERELAIELASNVRGVRSVNSKGLAQ
ncbi:MAG: BON domain-containing protein [Sinimarinibacterium sp.]|jgi:osmotically-inducible protein OsmY